MRIARLLLVPVAILLQTTAFVVQPVTKFAVKYSVAVVAEAAMSMNAPFVSIRLLNTLPLMTRFVDPATIPEYQQLSNVLSLITRWSHGRPITLA